MSDRKNGALMEKVINPPKSQWTTLLQRPAQSIAEIESTVNDIFMKVKLNGDVAVKEFTQLFDGVSFDKLEVAELDINAAESQIDKSLKQAIQLAANNIRAFHAAQMTGPLEVETMPGVHCWQEKRPINKVGLYIPGGSAPLFSTVLMLAIPAVLAGCKEITLCTPPDKKGEVNPAILYAAKLCGVTNIYRVGGIQAIAAMTFGTDTISKVYKIFGPGNQFVTVAKQISTKYGVAIDMPAGPSELLVFADDSANASFIASDLLSQAEHGVDSQVVLISTSEKLLKEVEVEVDKQLIQLPRKDIAAKSIANSKLILVGTKEVAIDLINDYAPEHFIVCSTEEEFFVENIMNAGSVFIGNFTPESAGDYASGTNHTLPTNGYAKQYSGVNLDSFMKSMTFQKITKEGIKNIGPTIELMAAAEGLQAHKNAVSLRLKSLKND